MKKRHAARELALQTLYACEIGSEEDNQRVFDTLAENAGYADDVRDYAWRLVAVTWPARKRLDERIGSHAANWHITRMAVIDRNVLRLAVAELESCPDTPARVVMDEAVELAKTYGTEESSRFVNGVIDSVFRGMSRPAPPEQIK